MDELANTILMSEGTALFLKALGGIVTGILVSTGHLDVANQDSFSQTIQTGAGAIVTIISAYYILEHAFQSAKAEIVNTQYVNKPETPPVQEPTPPTQPAA